MYATCLFCNKALRHNEALETFPVGKRLAFDAAKGRLWVVCSHCERWNLSPLEERWEVIEAAEKLYRDTRRRVATDNIGLAKLANGTTLVRIGEPLRPEVAAWRYGDQFGRRRRRQLLVAGGGVAAIAALLSAGVATGLGIGLIGPMIGGASTSRTASRSRSSRRFVLIGALYCTSGAGILVRRRWRAAKTASCDQLALQERAGHVRR